MDFIFYFSVTPHVSEFFRRACWSFARSRGRTSLTVWYRWQKLVTDTVSPCFWVMTMFSAQSFFSSKPSGCGLAIWFDHFLLTNFTCTRQIMKLILWQTYRAVGSVGPISVSRLAAGVPVCTQIAGVNSTCQRTSSFRTEKKSSKNIWELFGSGHTRPWPHTGHGHMEAYRYLSTARFVHGPLCPNMGSSSMFGHWRAETLGCGYIRSWTHSVFFRGVTRVRTQETPAYTRFTSAQICLKTLSVNKVHNRSDSQSWGQFQEKVDRHILHSTQQRQIWWNIATVFEWLYLHVDVSNYTPASARSNFFFFFFFLVMGINAENMTKANLKASHIKSLLCLNDYFDGLINVSFWNHLYVWMTVSLQD